MALNLRSYEHQAWISVVLAACAYLGCVAAGGYMVMKYSAEFGIPVKLMGRAFLAVMGSLGLAMALGVVGFFVALNSAGQKRNTKSQLSWTGFFMNAAAIALAGSLLVFYWFVKFPV